MRFSKQLLCADDYTIRTLEEQKSTSWLETNLETTEDVRSVSLHIPITTQGLRRCARTTRRPRRRWKVVHQQSNWHLKLKLHRVPLADRQRHSRRLVSNPSSSFFLPHHHHHNHRIGTLLINTLTFSATSTSITCNPTPYKRPSPTNCGNASATSFLNCGLISSGRGLSVPIRSPCSKSMSLRPLSLGHS